MKKYNSVQDLFQDLPDKVLLVGNGTVENKSNIIDNHPFVIRFNGFEIDGYEDHVGTKVDAISVHCSDLTQPHTKDLRPVYDKYSGKVPIFTTSPIMENSKPDILHVESSTVLFNCAHPYTLIGKGRLSSGVSLIMNLVVFFGKEIDLIGFDFMKSGHYYNPNHNNRTKNEFGKPFSLYHKVELEERLIMRINGINFL